MLPANKALVPAKHGYQFNVSTMVLLEHSTGTSDVFYRRLKLRNC